MQKSHVNQKQESAAYATRARRCASIGQGILIAAGAGYLVDQDITRPDALAYSTAVYAGVYLRYKLSNDYAGAAFNTFNPKQELHRNISRPLQGLRGKFALAASFVMAYVATGHAAEKEKDLAEAQKYEAAVHAAPTLPLDARVKGNGKVVAFFCRGEDVKTIVMNGALYKVPCGGLNLDPALMPS